MRHEEMHSEVIDWMDHLTRRGHRLTGRHCTVV
jgi:hypothetical protein